MMNADVAEFVPNDKYVDEPAVSTSGRGRGRGRGGRGGGEHDNEGP